MSGVRLIFVTVKPEDAAAAARVEAGRRPAQRPPGRPKTFKQAVCMDAAVTRSTPQWRTR